MWVGKNRNFTHLTYNLMLTRQLLNPIRRLTLVPNLGLKQCKGWNYGIRSHEKWYSTDLKTNKINEFVIDINDSKSPLVVSDECILQLNTINEKRKLNNKPFAGLRVTVESGGCHGYQNVISLIKYPYLNDPVNNTEIVNNHQSIESQDKKDKKDPQSNLDYDESQDYLLILGGKQINQSDLIHNNNKNGKNGIPPPAVIIDKISMSLIHGSKIDFIKELIGSTFQVIDNPNADSSCGCKVSFGIKF